MKGLYFFKCYQEFDKEKNLKIKDICDRQNKLRVPEKVAMSKIQKTQRSTKGELPPLTGIEGEKGDAKTSWVELQIW